MPRNNVSKAILKGHDKAIAILEAYFEKFPEQKGNVHITDVSFEDTELVTVKLRVKVKKDTNSLDIQEDKVV